MRKRIQRAIILGIVLALLASYAVLILFQYSQSTALIKNELKQEAEYISEAIENEGERYLDGLSKGDGKTRITLVAEDGTVLFDTNSDSAKMENHSNRPEIIQAEKDGSGTDIRRSNSLNEEMIYYALEMPDGRVLRLARTANTALVQALYALPPMGITFALLFLIAVLLSRRVSKKLVDPINHIDLENPLENDTYEELGLLLQRIDEENRQKEEAQNMRQEFSANVSHELKTPLTSISGYAEILKEGLVPEKDVPATANYIYKEARRLMALIEDIMRLSKLDEGAVGAQKEEVDLYTMVLDISTRLEQLAQQQNIKISVSGENVTVFGIRHVLDEMIYNICQNAVKYNKPGGSVNVWVGNTPQGPKVLVQDTGIGIPQDETQRIFERFYRVDKSHSKETGGTGLGLSIVKHGAELHHAKVTVKSKVGIGTQMALQFPTEEEALLEEQKEEEKRQKEEEARQKREEAAAAQEQEELDETIQEDTDGKGSDGKGGKAQDKDGKGKEKEDKKGKDKKKKGKKK